MNPRGAETAGRTTDIVRLGRSDPAGFDAAVVERELAALWRSEGAARGREGAARGQEGGGTVARACRATLVAAGDDGDDTRALLDDVARLYPSRVILVGTDASLTGARAWVSATCSRLGGGSSLVCCETVHLEAPPGMDRLVASGVRSLAVGGVPLVALCERISPLAMGWVRELAADLDFAMGSASRLGVDEGLALWRRCLDGASVPPMRDLLWTELVDWRRAVASRFDGPRVPALGAIRSVSVTVAEGPGGTLKAWLLLGWLASRLGWRAVGGEPGRGRPGFEGPGGPIAVNVLVSRAPDPGTTLLGVALEFTGGLDPICWSRLPAEGAILIEERGKPAARINQAKTSGAGAVVEEMWRRRTSDAARAAMQSAMDWGERSRSR